jgi:gamma-polyglutamate biosynthesis protein CapA
MSKLDRIILITQKIFYTLVIIVIGLTIILAFDPTSNKTVFEKKLTTYNLKPTTLFLAGDVMLSRNVGTKMFEAKNFSLPFEKVRGVISQADISFANLESQFSNQGSRITEGLVFKAEPQTIFGLSSAGFDILSTANNHSLDQGIAGIEYTNQLLKDHGIASVGTGELCHQGKIFKKNNIKFGFLAYSYAAHNDGGRVPDPNVCDWKDERRIFEDIANLKPQIDFLIVSAHMGEEYKRNPEQINVERVHAALDAGADMFVGHHPHWIQTIEEYQGKWIFYSLGNFVFDQMWSTDTREGLGILVNFFEKQIESIELKPVVIDNFCCPRWADLDETRIILNKLDLTSNVLIPQNEDHESR